MREFALGKTEAKGMRGGAEDTGGAQGWGVGRCLERKRSCWETERDGNQTGRGFVPKLPPFIGP